MLLRNFILFLTILWGASAKKTVETIELDSSSPNATVAPIDDRDTFVMTTETPEVIVPCSNGTQWTCNDDKCIRLDQKCDGMIDCADASDEYLEVCKDSEPRWMFGLVLHCSSSCGPYHEKLCPQICCYEPQYCYYALMAENEKYATTCRLPSFPEHGTFSIKPYKEVNGTDMSERPDFWLNYTCDNTYVLVENARVECKNGSWVKNDVPDPFCSEACPLNRNSNFTYTCPRSNNITIPCGPYVAIDTEVLVSRKEPRLDSPTAKPVALHMLCRGVDRSYNLSEGCVKEIDDFQKEFENPTMEKMTEYETKFNGFKTNETNHEFETLVSEFHIFENYVKGNLSMMHEKAEKCDITLDLLIWDLSEKRREDAEKKKKSEKAKEILDE